jgi:non-ribosomal peptide synthetase component F
VIGQRGRFGKEDIIIGSPGAGRSRAETEGLIGFFINTLPLRTDLTGNPTFEELLNRVSEVVFGAYVHQNVPFEKLVEELRPERNINRHPVFDVTFNYSNAPLTRKEHDRPKFAQTLTY